MTESDMDQLIKYHNRCKETSELARDMDKPDVADWIDYRISTVEDKVSKA